MEHVKKKRRKAVVNQKDCVACGCCVKVCPLSAIQVIKGVAAQVMRANAWVVGSAPKSARPAS